MRLKAEVIVGLGLNPVRGYLTSLVFLGTLTQPHSDDKRLTVAHLDPLKGKRELLRTIPKEIRQGFHDALSPDGSTLALGSDDQQQIRMRLLSLMGQPMEGIYCGSLTAEGGTLLYVDLQGVAEVVSQSRDIGGGTFIAAVPSPDGRYLSLSGADHYSNAWLMDGF